MNLQHLGYDASVALEAVCDVVRFTRTLHDDTIERVLTKTDASPVTALDLAVQAFIASRLEREFPNDPLIGEETIATISLVGPFPPGPGLNRRPLCDPQRASPKAQRRQSGPEHVKGAPAACLPRATE